MFVTFPPADNAAPSLWMTIDDAFSIKGRGIVVTGRLEGTGELGIGDALMCDGQRWPIDGIEQFRNALTAALPGSNIGILLRDGPPREMLRGRTVQFARWDGSPTNMQGG